MSFDKQWQTQLDAMGVRFNQSDFVSYVLKACRDRRAFLFSAPDGWVVLEPRVEPIRHVFVLAAFCSGPHAITRYEPKLFEYAARLNINVLRFEAARPGYSKVMPKRGWTQLADGKTWEKRDGRR